MRLSLAYLILGRSMESIPSKCQRKKKSISIRDTAKILIKNILKLQRKELKIKNNTLGCFFYNTVFYERIESVF
jgi:hypothetical protein